MIGAAVGATEKRYPVPAADGVTIDADAQVILVRSQQSVYAFALACPHQNTALRWRADDQRFQCPKHESKYKPDGTFISGRATRNMDRLPIKRAGDAVIVDVDVAYKSDAQPAEWAAAKVALDPGRGLDAHRLASLRRHDVRELAKFLARRGSARTRRRVSGAGPAL